MTKTPLVHMHDKTRSYLLWLFQERAEPARIICLTAEYAIIDKGKRTDGTESKRLDVERSAMDQETWQWLSKMDQSADEAVRIVETSRVGAKREHLREWFEWARAATELFRLTHAKNDRHFGWQIEMGQGHQELIEERL